MQRPFSLCRLCTGDKTFFLCLYKCCLPNSVTPYWENRRLPEIVVKFGNEILEECV